MLAADAQAIVYQGYDEIGSSEVYGCSYAGRRPFLLGPFPYGGSAGSGGVGPIALAGSIVAVGVDETFPSPGHSFDKVLVQNLATGSIIHKIPSGSPAEPGNVGIGDVLAVVVTRDGSVAWIVGTRRELGGVQVRSVDATGSRLLAASSEIATDSLALAGSTLYWTQGGKPMSAVLE